VALNGGVSLNRPWNSLKSYVIGAGPRTLSTFVWSHNFARIFGGKIVFCCKKHAKGTMINIFKPQGVHAAPRSSILHQSVLRASATRQASSTPSDWNYFSLCIRCLIPTLTTQLKWSRCASTDAGQHSTGHITAGPNEGVLFFDSRHM
jgi:hypothetical protein